MSDNITGAEQGALPPGTRVAEHRAGATPSAATPLHLASIVSPSSYVVSSPQLQQSIGPVPSLSQLTATTSPSAVYTKIINISNIRNANITNPSIVSALTKPRVSNVRTQLFPTSVSSTPSTPTTPETHGASPSQQQLTKSPSTPRKRARPDELPPGCDNLSGTRAKVMEHKWARSWCIKESYNESVAENYFLGTGGTMMDYFMWRKRPRSAHYEAYLRQHQLEPPSSESTTAEPHTSTVEPAISRPVPPLVSKETPIVSVASAMERLTQSGLSSYLTATARSQHLHSVTQRVTLAPLRITQSSGSTVLPNIAVLSTPHRAPPLLIAGTTTSSTHTSVPEIQPKTTSSLSTSPSSNPSTSTAPAMINISQNPIQNSTASVTGPVSSPRPGTTPQTVATSTVSSNRSTRSIASAFPATGNQEQIVEKAKQEAYVMQRISELQREGLWTERRLPKVQEVQRCKSHWDYLLEEMVWLAADFAQERKWKKAAAKKCARMVQKYFQDKAMAAQKAEKAQELQLKRIASYIAKEVKTFWSSVEKLVEFKQQTRLEEKRKQALDQHLSFIVDQTEKYSQLLAEGMNKSVADQSANQTANSSRVPSPSGQSDDEFKPGNQSDSDDEETIAQAEAADESDKQTEEIAALQRESQMELEDFLKVLPKDYLENRDKIVLSDSEHKNDDAQLSDSGSDSENKENKKKKDEDFKADSQGESEDDEDTINEQEKVEGSLDHKQELDDLQAENEMSVEELRKKYLNLPALPDNEDSNSKQSMEDSDDSESSGEEEDEESEESTDENSEEDEDETLKEDDKLGLKMLVEDEATKDSNSSDKKPEDDDLINDVAALAESIQPKGNTLSSTSVVTPVPFLLKHSLREYQHIGLDWLVTMFERKLNGILADEMGLGKTIQTIALLAHLACEKGDWGPHLIIVPTSVMLNWEMECKKWCPGFKILTYYGTQKERKLKRTGWTKPNAFHICITSYKLVIQDHQSFRRKKWKYLILDEAQNIKNFKSQRWQLLLNFQTQQRLLLTGTPLQNNLMELWSLMHFLMPNVFQSHREFKEWFSNPVTGMIEGNSEYNESIIKRLHKVLRPFLLRRLKSEVEKQMPQKFEHIIMCRLSKRQRFLYDDYMSRAKTRETLVSGNLLSVINVLMQLRKVCNHPNLFEVRPTVSPFQCESLQYLIPSIVYSALDYDLFKHVDLDNLYLRIVNLEYTLSAYSAFRTCRYRAPKKLIEMIDDLPEPPPPCPKGQVRIRVKQVESKLSPGSTNVTPSRQLRPIVSTPLKINTVAGVKLAQSPIQPGVKLRMAGPTGYSVQIVSSQGVKGAGVLKPGDQRVSVPTGFAQLVQTQLGKHILLTQNASLPQTSTSGTTTVLTSTGQRLTVLSKPVTAISTTPSPQKTAVVNSTTKMITPTIATVVTATKQVGVDSLLESSQLATEQSALSGMSIKQSLSSLHQQLQSMSPVTQHMGGLNNSSHSLQMQTRQSSTSDIKVDDIPKLSDAFKSEWNDKSSNSRQAKLFMLHRLNEWRCHASPMYGRDLRDVVTMTSRSKRESDHWMGAYVVFDEVAKGEKIWEHGGVLREFVKSPEAIVEEMQDMFSRFVFCVPAVSAKPLSYRVLNPPQSKYWGEKRDEYRLIRQMSPRAALLHPIASAMCTQFPDPRLIQYDCGKLQTLDLLLRRLKYGGHRVLIFTQMTRMLDVLEAFLNFHGHIYLRLDGTTKVDQRQLLMERFNGNTKIFAFILSTRSGGVGVNLTGADTVIFYDSDWNPTMDAQAQDRCHRIGQTRDVHIYRLVSEKTIEENILKKANQKRMLGDLAIEGGNFTTAYFKSSTIQDLFNVDTAEDDANARMSEVLNKSRTKELKEIEASPVPSTTSQIPPSGPASAASDDRAALGALENALAACEDDQDVQAARTAKAEAVADLAEFDESIPLEEHEKEQEMSKAELEVQNLMKQLTPIERYAMRFVEATEAQWSAEQLAAAERQIEDQKREWEENRLAALRQEEERRSRQAEEDSEMLTFSREDATNQIWLSDNTKEQMPMWCPPTPPTQDTDVYLDYSMGFLYEMSVMSESQLPPVYVRKEAKRTRHEAGLPIDTRRSLKISRKDELVYEPRSLFDRPSPELIKMRRELKQQRYRGIIRPQLNKVYYKVQTTSKPQPDPPCWHSWTVHEDMALLKVIQTFQGLPLNLMIISPGHTPNWDFAADYVNSTSITYRSPKQCRHRYETVLISREEGRVLHDTSSRKKKTKNIYTKHPQQFKTNRPMRTGQLYAQDNNSTFSQLMNQRFDALKQIASKRPVTTKAVAGNALTKNSKHTAVLTEYGIDYEHPMTPVEVAARRAERIAREKQKLGSMTAEQQQRQSKQPSLTLSTVTQPTTIVPASPSTSQTPSPGPGASTSSAVVPVVQTQQPIIQPQQATLIVSQSSIGGVTPSGVTVATPVQVSVGSSPAGTPTLRTQRIVSSPLQGGTVTNVTGLTPAHLAQRLIVTGQPVVSKTTGATGNISVATSKAYSPAQLNYYRQQVLKQQQQLRVQGIQTQTVKGVTIGGQPATVQVAVTQGQQRAQYSLQFVKQQGLTVASSQGTKQGVGVGVARQVSDTEMAALIKQRQLQQQQQKINLVHNASTAGVSGGVQAQGIQAGGTTTVQTLTQAQLLAQAGIQVQQAGTSGTTQVATLVKAVSAAPGGGTSSVTIPVTGVTLGPQVKAAIAAAQQQQVVTNAGVVTAGSTVKTATTLQPSQLRQLQIHQHLLAQKKFGGQKITQLAQVAGKGGVATQLIVQTPKTIQQFQQLQQVMRGPQLAAAVSQGGQVVLTTKAVSGQAGLVSAGQAGVSAQGQTATARVIPVNAAGQPQNLKQTIQVVTATSTGQATLVRPQVSVANALTGALTGTIKVTPSGTSLAQQTAILSQVSAALQGQPVTVRQAGSPVRIQTASGTPLVAMTVQSTSQQQPTSSSEHARLQKKQ